MFVLTKEFQWNGGILKTNFIKLKKTFVPQKKTIGRPGPKPRTTPLCFCLPAYRDAVCGEFGYHRYHLGDVGHVAAIYVVVPYPHIFYIARLFHALDKF